MHIQSFVTKFASCGQVVDGHEIGDQGPESDCERRLPGIPVQMECVTQSRCNYSDLVCLQGGGTGNQRHKMEARKLGDDFQRALQRYQEVASDCVSCDCVSCECWEAVWSSIDTLSHLTEQIVRTTLQKERESVAKARRDTHDMDEESGEKQGLLERERERERRQEFLQVLPLHFSPRH